MKTVYGSERCPKCVMLVRELESSNEKFKYVDIFTLRRKEQLAIIEKAGTMDLPIVLEE